MYSKVNYGIVGFFVLLFTAALLVFVFWLGKFGGTKEYNTYKVEITDSISGLSKDSVVKLRGVNIGRVSKIEIDPNNIKITDVYLDIKSSIRIKEDMKAYTQMMGITGLLFIEIDGGTNEASFLNPTETTIPIIKTGKSWVDKTRKDFGNISSNFVSLISRADDVLSKENIKQFSSLIKNFNTMSEKFTLIEDRVLISMDEIDKSVIQFKTSMKKIDGDFSHASKSFSNMQNELKEMKGSITPALNNLNKVIKKFSFTLDRGDYNIKDILEPVLIDIGKMTIQIDQLATEISRSPNDLIFKGKKNRRGPGE